MIQRSPPKTAMLPHWAYSLLAAIGLFGAPLAQAQTPAVSTVLAMSGSRNPDGVILGPDRALYGASAASSSVTGALFYRVTPDGSSVETLYQFGSTDGVAPAGALLLGSDGLFYGTTQFSNGGVSAGGGTVFRIAPDGTGFSVLHEFAPSTSNNVNSNPISTQGNAVHGALIEGSDGFLYGVARFGGPTGAGTVFKIDKDGSGFSVLHAFAPITSAAGATIVNADGAHPRAGLVESAGYFYGTTNTGGANGQGTIFRMRFDGSEFSVLHVFTTPTTPSGSTVAANEDGALSQAGLTDGGDGLLYGTTTVGGANGLGVIYSITPDGSVRTTLHDFAAADGSQPVGTLLLAMDGRLYGTTSTGGTTSGGGASTLGTVFSIARDGTGYTNLYNFESTTGSTPGGRLVQLNATEFFGTTSNGGRCGNGTIFLLSLAGTTVTGDTSCGEDSGGGGGGGISWLSLLFLAVLLAAGAAHSGMRSFRRVVPAGSSNTSDAQRLSQSAPSSRSPWTM
jgi:uncharacterized repeat protein (TIGR03803 family)